MATGFIITLVVVETFFYLNFFSPSCFFFFYIIFHLSSLIILLSVFEFLWQLLNLQLRGTSIPWLSVFSAVVEVQVMPNILIFGELFPPVKDSYHVCVCVCANSGERIDWMTITLYFEETNMKQPVPICEALSFSVFRSPSLSSTSNST